MEAIKILEEAKDINWDYDEEADVQYLSIGEPKKAAGVDIGQGIVIRLDEEKNEVVGLTVIGMRSRLIETLR